MTDHKTATREEWAAARAELLEREKEVTRLSDEVARQRRDLPWVPVEADYTFETPDGPKSLAELFDGRSQLVVYHFMYGPDYESGCPTCSSITDGVNGVLPHVNARDVTVALVSQAPLEKLQAFKQRMGWDIPWVSSLDNDLSVDLGFSSGREATREWVEPIVDGLPPVAPSNASQSGTDIVGYLSQSPGFSCFALEDGVVYQTYSTTNRGVEFLMGFYGILDRVPKGRDESEGFQLWLRRHDEYAGQDGAVVAA